jgi:hypothetical protein
LVWGSKRRSPYSAYWTVTKRLVAPNAHAKGKLSGANCHLVSAIPPGIRHIFQGIDLFWFIDLPPPRVRYPTIPDIRHDHFGVRTRRSVSYLRIARVVVRTSRKFALKSCA